MYIAVVARGSIPTWFGAVHDHVNIVAVLARRQLLKGMYGLMRNWGWL